MPTLNPSRPTSPPGASRSGAPAGWAPFRLGPAEIWLAAARAPAGAALRIKWALDSDRRCETLNGTV